MAEMLTTFRKWIPQMTEFSSDSYTVYVHCCALLKDKLNKLGKVWSVLKMNAKSAHSVLNLLLVNKSL